MSVHWEDTDKSWTLRVHGCRCCGRGGHTIYPGVPFTEEGFVKALRQAKRWNKADTKRWFVGIVEWDATGNPKPRKVYKTSTQPHAGSAR